MKKISLTVMFSFVLTILLGCMCIPIVTAAEAFNLNATYGDVLNDVSLPEGYSWAEAAPETTTVGSVGVNTFEVTYTSVTGEVENATASITVSPAYFSSVSIKTDGNLYYTGKPIEPDVTIFFKDEILVKDKDYKVAYEDNVNVGTAKAVIEGIGNFKGKSTVNFFIEKIDVENLELSEYDIELATGDSFKLNASIYPSNASIKDVIWSSSDETVATIDEEGNIKGRKNGVAYVKAVTVDGGYEAICTVNVVTHITDMKITVGNVKMFYKETYQLKTVIMPFDVSNKDIIWSTSDPEVATVDENGLVTATGKGTATITAETVDGGLIDTCEINVTYNWWQRIIWVFLGCLWYF